MQGSDLIARIRALHEKAKLGTLDPSERAEYQHQRTELGRLLLVAQHLSHGGKTLRSALRIAQMIKVEVDFGGPTPDKTTTIDLASGGFAALLAGNHPVGRPALFTLSLPGFEGGTRLVKGSAKVASARPHGSSHRVSFAFDKIEPNDREFLEMVLIEFVLRRFPPSPVA